MTFTKYKSTSTIQNHDSRIQFTNFKDRRLTKQRKTVTNDTMMMMNTSQLRAWFTKVDKQWPKPRSRWINDGQMEADDDDEHEYKEVKRWQMMMMIWWREELKRDKKDYLIKRRERVNREEKNDLAAVKVWIRI